MFTNRLDYKIIVFYNDFQVHFQAVLQLSPVFTIKNRYLCIEIGITESRHVVF